jgi:hypothetical protein
VVENEEATADFTSKEKRVGHLAVALGEVIDTRTL